MQQVGSVGSSWAHLPQPKKRRGAWAWIRKHKLEIAMVLPFASYILYFMLVPVMQSIWYSFVHAGTSELTLDNYREVVNKSTFADAFTNTIGITIIGVSLEMLIGMAIAVMLSRQFRGRGIFRTVVLLPLGVPTLVAGAAMLYFVGFNGYLNRILMDLNIIDLPIYWQQSGWRGMVSIALADVWKSLPLVVLILLAGLESIAEDVYEAASIDGASGWQKFVHHTLPLLMPSITMALILRSIDAFRIFDIAMVLAGRSVPVMSSFVYFEYAARNVNVASAAAVILLMMIATFVVLYMIFVERRSEVDR
jgi:trehalose transport system permease protein